VKSIVTSSASNDSGLFETSLADERYLPFEGSGAVSQWRLELPVDWPQFDYDTISDLVMHLRYTAREGGLALQAAATAALGEKIGAAATVGSVRLLSVRHEFPTEWARFSAATIDSTTPLAPLTITLREEHYPFWAQQVEDFALYGVELFASAGTDVKIYDAETDDPPGSQHESTPSARPERRRHANRLAARRNSAPGRRVHHVLRRQLADRTVARAHVGRTKLNGWTSTRPNAIRPARRRGAMTSSARRSCARCFGRKSREEARRSSFGP
jgi:hypothetical protein